MYSLIREEHFQTTSFRGQSVVFDYQHSPLEYSRKLYCDRNCVIFGGCEAICLLCGHLEVQYHVSELLKKRIQVNRDNVPTEVIVVVADS